MICANCGTENAPGAKFCNECATRLSVVCPACATANPPAAKFCSECATPLGTARAPAVATPGAVPGGGARPEGAPVAERRLVSVLFADLVGFTHFAEGRDAEEVRETLSRYFEVASDVVGRYGGTVEKFIGDAVMALWGAPVAREDDAERAVRAALELVDAVRHLGAHIEARAAVLTGEAAVTLGAAGQGMVAGDLVNTASRLQSIAAAGTVLVGEATVRAADRAIAFEPAGEQALKGKAAPVEAWRALRVVAERGGRNRRDSLEAPFVGRETELRLLKDLFHATSREGRARLVSVIGPAGIGKSRLAWEFLKYIDGLLEPVLWHDGRSPAYGDGITFWALGEMVRGRCGLLETDDEATTRAKVAESVAAHVPDEGERRWIEPALLALLGFGSGIGSDQLFGAWRTFFERLAAEAPVVMVFEDFHHADSGLLDFVDHLLEWSRNAPVYVLTLSRPELLERRPDWGTAKRNSTSLHLEPLPEPVMRELLLGLVPGLPGPTIRTIVARADGIPLYAVEMVRMLVAEGRLILQGSAYVPTGDLTALAVPETLTALIASRLDALEPADRTLLQHAAVLGQSATADALSAVSGVTVDELQPRLRSLVRRELLAVEADPRSPERGQFGFVQALIREVAYNTLARADRKARHLAAARFFESLGSDELAGALAGQYLAAYQAASEGPEAEALAGQARIALRAAAERAAALGAHDQAVRFYEQALGVTHEPDEEAQILERAADSASLAGRHDAAERFVRRAIEILRAGDDRVRTALATAALGRILVSARLADVAVGVLEAADAEFADLDAPAVRAATGSQLARAHYLNGNTARSIEIADPVLAIAEHLDLVPILADTLITAGSAYAQSGRVVQGLALLRAGEDLAERHGLAEQLTRALGNRAGYEATQDPKAALAAARAGMAMTRRLGSRAQVIVGNAAGLAFRVGEWAWVQETVQAELAEDLQASDRAELVTFAVQLSALRGEPLADLLAELDGLTAGITDPYRLGGLDWVRAGVAFTEGRLVEARDVSRRVIEAFNDAASLPFPARAALWARDVEGARADLAGLDAGGPHGPAIDADRRTIRAGIAALDGRSVEALALYRVALRDWRDLGLEWDEALCAIDMASLLDATDPEVRAAADRAREILVRLGARPFLARLDAALARRDAAEPGRGGVPKPAVPAATEAPA